MLNINFQSLYILSLTRRPHFSALWLRRRRHAPNNNAHSVSQCSTSSCCVVRWSPLLWSGVGRKQRNRERERASIGVTTHAHAQTIKSFYLETLKLISSLLCVQYQNNCFGTFVCSRYTNRRVQKIR
jgi:hypothetical protein